MVKKGKPGGPMEELSQRVLPDGTTLTVTRQRADAERFAGAWPFGLVELVGEVYGMVLGTDTEQAWAMKIQLPEMDAAYAEHIEAILRIRAAATAAELARKGVEGLWVPMVYQRDKEGERVEMGMALFGWPARDDTEWQRWAWASANTLVKAFPGEMQGIDLPDLPPFIDISPRPRSLLGTVFVDAGVLDGELLLLTHTEPAEDGLLWTALGPPSSIRHVPMLGVVLGNDEGEK